MNRRNIQRRASNSSVARDAAKGPNASSATAAAVATAATATAYSNISQKLEGIEGLISALKVGMIKLALGAAAACCTIRAVYCRLLTKFFRP